jgi:hypothetical protein
MTKRTASPTVNRDTTTTEKGLRCRGGPDS